MKFSVFIVGVFFLLVHQAGYSQALDLELKHFGDVASFRGTSLGDVDGNGFALTYHFDRRKPEAGWPYGLEPFLSKSSAISAWYTEYDGDTELDDELVQRLDLTSVVEANIRVLETFVEANRDSAELEELPTQFNPGALPTTFLPFTSYLDVPGNTLTEVPRTQIPLLARYDIDGDSQGISGRVVLADRYIVDVSYQQFTTDYSNGNAPEDVEIERNQWGVELGLYINDETTLSLIYQGSKDEGSLSTFGIPLDSWFATINLDIAQNQFDIEQYIFDNGTNIDTGTIPSTFTPVSAPTPIDLQSAEVFIETQDNFDNRSTQAGIALEYVGLVDSGKYVRGYVDCLLVDSEAGDADGIKVFGEFDYFFTRRLSLGASILVDLAGTEGPRLDDSGIETNTYGIRLGYFITRNIGIEASYSLRDIKAEEDNDDRSDELLGRVKLENEEAFSVSLKGRFFRI